MMGIDAILNYRRISDRIASSGQPGASQFEEIARAGYQVVINLAMPDSDHAIADEGRLVTTQGMVYLHIPVPFDAPTRDHLQTFLRAMAAFEGQRLWVHCALNYRVSAFLYLYQRLVRGTPADEAARCLLPSWEPDATWRRFMQTAADDSSAGA